ncbi:GtrA family protein [Mesorhizobium ciceri]|uniref:GtrA family protein n=1 Tax=Mesorhizobium ciceri TaxID=39645 RepID=A0AB38TLW7_9HYPH|nr:MULTISPECIES: GtrA family protein [Mesorhizobium]MBZ9887238.1 GtrA family protein [Mesorhizobium sp. BR1-1-3]MDF3217308.1 GtrA family protein [Mesorhizobium ciceri]UTU55052.1 GtrA family protein [Mesorhizobium ciceri]
MPEHLSPGDDALTLLARFGMVGISATILYAALVAAFSKSQLLGFTPIQASLGAYAAATLFSYLAHKYLTFVSGRSHRTAAPRFLLLAATGFAIAYGAPALMTVKLGLPLVVPVLITCLLVPTINFFVLDRWVFADRRPGRQGNRSRQRR